MKTHAILICLLASFSVKASSLEDFNLKAEQKPFDIFHDKKFETDEKGHMHGAHHGEIQEKFIEDVLSLDGKDVLEVCAGRGHVLELLLQRQNAQNAKGIKYTAVELNPNNMKLLKARYQKHSKREKGNWLGCANKDVCEFLASNPEKKLGKYKAVFAGFALQILTPVNYLDALCGLFNVMANGAKLYITQHSIHSGKRYTDEYIKRVEKADLIPFWDFKNRRFESDPVSMIKLLNAFGFRQVHWCFMRNVYPDTRVEMLGMIFKKDEKLWNAELVKKYLLHAVILQAPYEIT